MTETRFDETMLNKIFFQNYKLMGSTFHFNYRYGVYLAKSWELLQMKLLSCGE
jgi:hypothetical protein